MKEVIRAGCAVSIGQAATRIIERMRPEDAEDRVTDQLGDLRYYGVSEAAQSVHPVGNPISHSTHVGFNCPDVSETTIESMSCLPFAARRLIAGIPKCPRSRLSAADGVGQKRTQRSNDTDLFVSGFSVSDDVDRRSMWSDAVGVGMLWLGIDPNPVPDMWGTNGSRWYAMPFRVMPDLGQVPENGSHPSTKQRCHVLQHDVSRSHHANGSNHFPPESRTGPGKSGASPGERDVLAGEASADDVGIGILRGCHVADVHRIGEAKGEDARGVGIDFGDSDGVKAASALEPQVEAADAREQREDAQLRVRIGSPDTRSRCGPKGQRVGEVTGSQGSGGMSRKGGGHAASACGRYVAMKRRTLASVSGQTRRPPSSCETNGLSFSASSPKRVAARL